LPAGGMPNIRTLRKNSERNLRDTLKMWKSNALNCNSYLRFYAKFYVGTCAKYNILSYYNISNVKQIFEINQK